MTFFQEANKPGNRIFTDVFIKRRLPSGDYESDWLDISHLVTSGLKSLSYSLDSTDFDVGIFTQDNVNLTFNNRFGHFNDLDDSRSLWAALESRHLTKFKIESGYIGEDEEVFGEVSFQGLFDDRTFNKSDNDDVSVQILAREYVLQNLDVPAGTFGSAILASEAIFILLNRGEVIEQFGVDATYIQPDIDFILDDPAQYNGKKLNAVLNEILLLTNSVGFINSADYFEVRTRQVGPMVSLNFYSNARLPGAYKDNINAIRQVNSGRQRVKNVITFGAAISKSADHHLERYGITKKNITSDAVTNLAVRQSIADRMREEWQFPKQEMILTTDYIGNSAKLLGLCRIDVQPDYDVKYTELPTFDDPETVIDSAQLIGFTNGMFISRDRGYKIISVEHDLQAGETVLKLREKGKTLTDGWFDVLATAKYDVVFAAETTKSVNTAPKGIDAQCALVNILDPDDDLANTDIKISRPNSSTITLETPMPITKTFRLLVVEVLP